MADAPFDTVMCEMTLWPTIKKHNILKKQHKKNGIFIAHYRL